MEVDGQGNQEMSQGGRETRLIVLSLGGLHASTGIPTLPSSSPALLVSVRWIRIALLGRDATASFLKLGFLKLVSNA